MTTPHKGDRIAELIKEVEAVAKRLRMDVRKRALASGLAKNLQAAADRLRKQAAAVAGQVEKYAHEIRRELEVGGKKAPVAKKAAAKKARKVPAKRSRAV